MSTYKLTYFNGRGRAEITRLIFVTAGIEYEDYRISDWKSEKPKSPIGQLPYLTVDGVTHIPQSVSIARFVAKKLNLAGSDDLEQAKCDAVVDTVNDLQNAYYEKVFHAEKDQVKEATEKFLSNDALTHLARIDKLISLYGSNEFSVGSSLKWSDLFIFDITSIMISLKADILDNYKNILAVRKTVESNERVAKYLQTRPKTNF